MAADSKKTSSLRSLPQLLWKPPLLSSSPLLMFVLTDTVRLLDKLFSEDIFKVWEKPRQLVKFLVGVQKAINLSEGENPSISACCKTRKEINIRVETVSEQPVSSVFEALLSVR